jgi:hypothetical protein
MSNLSSFLLHSFIILIEGVFLIILGLFFLILFPVIAPVVFFLGINFNLRDLWAATIYELKSKDWK